MIFGTRSGQRTVLFSRQSEWQSEDKPEIPRHVYLYVFLLLVKAGFPYAKGKARKTFVDSLQKGKLNCEEVGKWARRDEQSSNI